jgi:vacuolar-type H+-ATPase subunit E/Vma4
MSLETILSAIEASGESRLAQLQQETETRIAQIQDEAEQKATGRKEEARQIALNPVASERARRLHQARLEALNTVAAAREKLIAATLEQTRTHLMELRSEPIYPQVLKGLLAEAIWVLGEEEINYTLSENGRQPWLEIDARDEALVRDVMSDLDIGLAVKSTQDCWGGVSACSGDGRIIVTNTLEARLEQALPYLRQDLATFFEAASEPAVQEIADI